MPTASAFPEWIDQLLPESARAAIHDALVGGEPLRAHALAPTARLLALAGALVSTDRPTLVVVPDDGTSRRLSARLREILAALGGPGVVELPRLDADAYRGLPAHPAVAARRVRALHALVGERAVVVVVPVAALLLPVPPRLEIETWGEEIRVGARVEIDALSRRLVDAGYRVVDVVTAPGDLARRGGLFDVWPPQSLAPLRVELWGDDVESIRRFDATTQRTTERASSFQWLPAREAPIDPESADALVDRLVGRARSVLADAPATEEGLPRLLEGLLAGIEGAPGLYRSGLVGLGALAPFRVATWMPEEIGSALDDAWTDYESAHAELSAHELPPPEELFIRPGAVAPLLDKAGLELAELPPEPHAVRAAVDLGARPPLRFVDRIEALIPALREAVDSGRAVVLLTETRGRRQRLGEILEEAGLEYREVDEDRPWPPQAGEIVLGSGALAEGAEFTRGGPLLLAEQELFGASPPPPPPRRRRTGDAFISDFRDLRPGDLVVHVDHGVARYTGLTRREGSGDEMLVLEYADGDRLLVPVMRLDLVQKYSGGEHRSVPLDKLGGPGWDRRRRSVRKQVKEIAEDLLSLYAKRRAARAPAFAPDTTWQQEFEAAFPHKLTPDQAATLEEIKRDLARGQPMDRLLCGDVGYGKTEVALRAAFKVVQEGWQVAVLAPTTVLAFQHLTTIRARMAAWPVRVEMVSRLVPPGKVRRILEQTREGRVDILVGTHKLLGKQVGFKRLGMLVVDEEQRFGVRHKEAIKSMSLGVHVLAMSATPIPRTLQMSLAGARDLSVIETPPRNRIAIQTHVSPWSDSLVAAAIRNEVRRGGQVYVVHPKVQSLAALASRISDLVPEATVNHAHGQMAESELESVMLRFIRGDAQVLVATSIVENGLDISRANTILIDDAHKFGLSQLYQMRGRVGRSDQRAYAYLLVPSRRSLTAEARRRLAALVEFSDLGSGFRLAALDLEIRGAGEFLGARQSGHITAVGFELYIQMLERAVRELRGTPLPEPPEPVTINLGLEGFLPEDYLPNAAQRLGIYKRLTAAQSDDEIRAVEEETEDRYGKLPAPGRVLFRLAELRVLAERQGAVAIDWAGDGIAVRYGERPRVDADRVIALLQRDSGARMTPAGVLKLRVGDERADRIVAARVALSRIVGEEPQP